MVLLTLFKAEPSSQQKYLSKILLNLHLNCQINNLPCHILDSL